MTAARFSDEAIALATTKSCFIATGVLLAIASAACVIPLDAQATPQGFKAPVISDTGAEKGPRQPIFFRHDIHAGQDQIPCMYCHASAAVSNEPGIPALQTCIGCHQIIAGSTPPHQAEIRKVTKAWSDKQPPEWIRIHAVPGFVHFPHMRHIQALGTGPESCANCHGEINRMPQVYQVATLRMGWCIRCHVARKVSRDCSVCHF